MGGSRTASVSQPFKVTAFVQDKDLRPDDPNPYADMNYTWTCEDLNLNAPCLSMKGELINFSNN